MYTKVLVVKREETGPLKDLDMKMGYKDIRWGHVDWIHLAPDKVPRTQLLLAHQGKEFLKQLSISFSDMFHAVSWFVSL
jgi:hypothetical protein